MVRIARQDCAECSFQKANEHWKEENESLDKTREDLKDANQCLKEAREFYLQLSQLARQPVPQQPQALTADDKFLAENKLSLDSYSYAIQFL